MRLKPDTDFTKFLLSIQDCYNDVFFETQDGDRLNLSSALSQYIFCSVVGQSYDWTLGTIRCENPDDILILAPFLQEGD